MRTPIASITLLLLALPLASAAEPVAGQAATPPASVPTPAKPPKALGPSHHLVDRVIPAYGMRTLAAGGDARVDTIAHHIRAFTADVETRVMSGELHRVAALPVDPETKKNGEATPAAAVPQLPEEARLLALLNDLTALEQRLRPSGARVPMAEQELLDHCFADLGRAADLLRFSLSDQTFAQLEAARRAWIAANAQALTQAREKKIAELMGPPRKLSRAKAEAAVAGQDFSSEVATPVVPAPVAAPAPKAAPVVEAAEEPTAPASDTQDQPVAEPAMEPAATEPIAEPAAEPAPPEPTAEPAVEPTPAPEEPIAETPAAEPAPVAEPEPAAQPEPAAEPAPAADPSAEPEPAAETPAPADAPAPASDAPPEL